MPAKQLAVLGDLLEEVWEAIQKMSEGLDHDPTLPVSCILGLEAFVDDVHTVDNIEIFPYVFMEFRTLAELFADAKEKEPSISQLKERRDYCKTLLSICAVCAAYCRRRTAATSLQRNNAEGFFEHVLSICSMAVYSTDVELSSSSGLFHEVKWATENLQVSLGQREPRQPGFKG